jgi:acyl-coenzyme A thioesterase PaaI-like protein
VTDVNDRYAKGRLELTDELSSNPGHLIAHGGVAFALADTVGGAADIDVRDRNDSVIATARGVHKTGGF